jgi:hypothetical protein
MRYRVMLLGSCVPALLVAQQPEMPRFRAGANLVRVDAYVSKDDVRAYRSQGRRLHRLRRRQAAADRELRADRGAPAESADRAHRATNVSDMTQQAANAARVFTLFFDRFTCSCPVRITRASRLSSLSIK